MIKNVSSKTCEDIYTIFTELNLFEKLPKDKQDFIKENRDKNYRLMFNKKIPVQFQISNKETMVVLSYLYLKYINKNPETKTFLLNKYKNNENEYQEKFKKKYNTNNLLKNKIEEVAVAELQKAKVEEHSIVEYKESFLKKILSKIKKIISRK